MRTKTQAERASDGGPLDEHAQLASTRHARILAFVILVIMRHQARMRLRNGHVGPLTSSTGAGTLRRLSLSHLRPRARARRAPRAHPPPLRRRPPEVSILPTSQMRLPVSVQSEPCGHI